MRILVVDDEMDILESTRVLLELEGHQVEVVREASAEVAAVQRFRPDVILQDLNMPDLSIDGMIAELRHVAPTTRVLLFTAAANVDDIQVRVGAAGVVRKPFELGTLLSALHAVAA